VLLPLLSWAQAGGIRGIVTDQDFEVPLANVRVTISETGDELRTQSSGSFYKDGLMPGSYTLIFAANGYSRLTRPQVIVTGSSLTDVNVELVGEYEEMDELVVRDIQLGGASEIGLLNLRMESSALMDSVGADLISRAGASDAAGALKLVSGTTVQDGKYAVVRGLPDRYVVSLLNGVRLPTSDPDKRAVQLDQYPSSLIESVQVVKSFTPDQQGDASGGAVDIVLRGIPEERILKFSVGTKWNDSDADGNNFLTHTHRDNDFFGKRDFNPPPDSAEENSIGTPDYSDPSAQIVPASFGVNKGEQPQNLSWGVEVGERSEVSFFGEDIAIGFLAAFNHESQAKHRTETSDKYIYGTNENFQISGIIADGNVAAFDELGSDAVSLSELFDISKSTEEINWNGAFGAGFEHALIDINYLHLFTHNTQDDAIQATDTRGRNQFNSDYIDFVDASSDLAEKKSKYYLPYRKSESIFYTERDTSSDQLSSKITLPMQPISLHAFEFKEPQINVKLSKSSSALKQQNELLDYYWYPGEKIFEIEAEYDGSTGYDSNVDVSSYFSSASRARVFGRILGWYVPEAAWLNTFTNSSGESYDLEVEANRYDISQMPQAVRDFIEQHPELDFVIPEYGWQNDDYNRAGVLPSIEVGVASNGTYVALDAGEQLGNYQHIWQKIVEESDQSAFDYKWDFENWTDDTGYLKVGLFQDSVERTFFQQTMSNKKPATSINYELVGNWEDNLADLYVANSNTAVYSSFADIQYDGEQNLDAFYYMLDLPVADYLTLRGGFRHEEFELKTFLEPDNFDFARTLLPSGGLGLLNRVGDGYAQDADYSRKDQLPSFGFDLNPYDKVTFRFNYAETVAKQQFKELVPIIQRKYVGTDPFYGNPDLQASPVANVDYRFDYTPYPGGLFSFSYFTKDIDDPIQYYKGQDDYGNTYTFVRNYPFAWVEGFEYEMRQDLSKFMSSLEGMKIGFNYTTIEGEVDLGNSEKSDVMEMPESLYNLFLTYNFDVMDLRLGVFYTYKGDTLSAVKNTIGSPTPAEYNLGYGTLNMTLSAKLTESLKLSLKVKNLTNPDIETVYREDGYEDALRRSYSAGREYSIGMSYTF
tara:strand:+ start:2002 stop:5301 length:3300 start_codon:yes stop_codon:yes gene_type:complete